jgi:phospholipid/cholesterol/gamma-HCH transport system substrate-binding protein
MDSKREQAVVGLFVLVAAGLLITVVFLLSGTGSRGQVPYRTYFKNAGGLAPGTEVRYAGGPAIGRVKRVRPDLSNPTLMEVDFDVRPDTPITTETRTVITSNSPLGENFLGLIPGKDPKAPRAVPGAILQSKEYVSFADIGDMIADLQPNAQELIKNLNARVIELKETLSHVNDLLNDRNRANISDSLANLRGILAENRSAIHSTVNNLNSSSAKIDKLLDDLKKTSAKANETLDHVDGMVTENRAEIHKAVLDLRKTLASTVEITDQINRLLNSNSENLDEIIENLRHITENMNDFTETIKNNPSTLIRSSAPKEHKPGQAPPQ